MDKGLGSICRTKKRKEEGKGGGKRKGKEEKRGEKKEEEEEGTKEPRTARVSWVTIHLLLNSVTHWLLKEKEMLSLCCRTRLGLGAPTAVLLPQEACTQWETLPFHPSYLLSSSFILFFPPKSHNFS
jgi:hypothetical protein